MHGYRHWQETIADVVMQSHTYARINTYTHAQTNTQTIAIMHTNVTYSTYTYKRIQGSVRISFVMHSREVKCVCTHVPRTSTAPIHKIMHKQTNGHAQTMHACIHTQIVCMPFGYKNMRRFTHIHIHIPEFTYSPTTTHINMHTYTTAMHINTHTRTCIHRHMGLHTKSIDRELVRPIHALRVLCHGTVKGKLFIRVAGT